MEKVISLTRKALIFFRFVDAHDGRISQLLVANWVAIYVALTNKNLESVVLLITTLASIQAKKIIYDKKQDKEKQIEIQSKSYEVIKGEVEDTKNLLNKEIETLKEKIAAMGIFKK